MCTQATPIDRATANRLNPLIGSLCTEDTLNDVSGMMVSMGYMLSQVESPPEGTDISFGKLYLFCNAIAAALDYEADNFHFFGQHKGQTA